MLRSYGVFLFLCRRGLRPLRVFSRNLCMQADVWAPAPTRETGRTPRERLLRPQNGMVPPVATVHGVNMPPAGGKMVSRI